MDGSMGGRIEEGMDGLIDRVMDGQRWMDQQTDR